MQSGLVLLSALLAVVVSAQAAATAQKNPIGEKVLALSKKCVAENKLPEDKAKLAFSQDLPQNDGERCFLECCYKGLNIIQENKFNLEGAMKVVNARFQKPDEKSLATKLVETCNKEVTANAAEKCSLGHAVRECFVKNGKEVNFFPTAL